MKFNSNMSSKISVHNQFVILAKQIGNNFLFHLWCTKKDYFYFIALKDWIHQWYCIQRNWNICIKPVPILRKSEQAPSEHTSAMANKQHPKPQSPTGKSQCKLGNSTTVLWFCFIKSSDFYYRKWLIFLNMKIIMINDKDQRKMLNINIDFTDAQL